MAKKKAIMTNAMRMLDKEKIAYDAVEYESDGEIGSHFGEKIAEMTGIPPEQAFKTLVVKGDKNGIAVCCIPVNKEVHLKKLAFACGDKKAEMIHVKDLLALTGYIRGGVSPIGMKKKYRTVFDASCLNFDKIAVSAGICGCTLILDTNDLIKITNATTHDVVFE